MCLVTVLSQSAAGLLMFKQLRYMGLASSVSGWLVILLAISRNPWFVFTENAFSDLGAVSANDPWLFNTGMILTGVMIVLYAVYLLNTSINKTGKIGGASMALTGFMLMMIGFFPEGTPYHYLVSVWFFSQGALTVLIWGLALIGDENWKRYGVIFIFLGVVGPLVAVVVPWPSTAVAEAYGILILNFCVAIMTWKNPRFSSGKR